MGIIPGQITNSVRYDAGGQTDNSFANNFMQVAAQMLAMRQERERTKQNQFASVFPTLAANNMIQPGTPTDKNYMGQIGNQGFAFSPQTNSIYGVPGAKSWSDVENYYQSEALRSGKIPLATALKTVAAQWDMNGGPGGDWKYTEQDLANAAMKLSKASELFSGKSPDTKKKPADSVTKAKVKAAVQRGIPKAKIVSDLEERGYDPADFDL